MREPNKRVSVKPRPVQFEQLFCLLRALTLGRLYEIMIDRDAVAEFCVLGFVLVFVSTT